MTSTNPITYRSIMSKRPHPQTAARRGISLIEVLVSIVVAAIGVFGVFALIPFAIRQAEIGMNEEAAITVGRNGIEDFEARRFTNYNRWAVPDFLDDDGNSATQFLTPFKQTTNFPYNIYCIDPWGFTNQDTPDPNFNIAPYSDFAGSFPRFRRITLFDQSGTQTVFSKALARELFSTADDVVHARQKDSLDLEYPQQFYFTGSARQHAGKTTWQMFVIRPFVDIPGVPPPGMLQNDQARYYVAVSLNRDPNALNDRATTGELAQHYDRLFRVLMPPGPVTQFENGGGDFTIEEVSAALPDRQIHRGRWMMLITADLTTPSNPVAVNIGFYRVMDVDDLVAAPPRFDVTLQGSDFTISQDPVNTAYSNVYAVLLPDVIAVYQRTMKLANSSSIWDAF